LGFLIDSSVLIDLERKSLSLRDVPSDHYDQWNISAVTVSELLFGLYRAQTQAQKDRRQAFLEGVLERVTVLAFDLQVAEEHARIWFHLMVSGLPIGVHDLLIAATAVAHGLDIMTLNVREFSRVPGLVVRQPSW
jgi:tRNA(fMet)-specific endonuclease VapC